MFHCTMPRPPGIAIVPLNLARFRCGRLEQAPASARVVTFPIHLAGVDLRVARENAGDLLEVLRQFDPLATQMWVTDRTGF